MKRHVILAAIALAVIPILSVGAAGTQEQPESEPAAVVMEGDGPSWTWDTTPHEIDWYIHMGWYGKRWNLDTLYDREVTARTGVQVDITTPAGGGSERLNTMLASRDFPDILTMGHWEAQFRQLQDAGLLHPLDELIDRYAPTFDEIIPDSMRNWYRYEDGNWYGFVSSFWAPEREERFAREAEAMGIEPAHMTPWYYMVARQDIMDEFGFTSEDFTDPDRVVEMLKQVKGYKYNDFEVLPIHFGPDGQHIGAAALDGFFAVPQEYASGDLGIPREEELYLEELLWVNRLYREGLIDDRVFTDGRPQTEERLASGNIFLFMGGFSDSWETLYRDDPDARYVAVGPLRNSAGDRPWMESGGVAGWTVSMIPNSANRPDRIIRFLEFLYSDEGQMLHYLGTEGETFEWTDDGKTRWTDEFVSFRESNPPQTVEQTYGLHTFFWAQDDIYQKTYVPREFTPAQEMTQEVQRASYPYVYSILPYSRIEPPGGTDESGLLAEIDVYWQAQIPKIVRAGSAEEATRIWKESVDRMYELGWEEVYTIMNQRFKANKEKLEIEHAWPPLLD